MPTLAGKISLITGAAHGFGAAMARHFAELGSTVILSDIQDADGEKMAISIGMDASYSRLDVTSEDDWKRIISEIEERHGRLDVLVNNAGIANFAPLIDTKLETFVREINCLLVGPFLGMREAAPLMEQNSSGSIINIASMNGPTNVITECVQYSAAKAGVVAMTKVAAIELGLKGIRVNSISPGIMDTMGPPLNEKVEALTKDDVALGRMGKPMDIAHMAAFLASDESAYCTASDYPVSGGWMAGINWGEINRKAGIEFREGAIGVGSVASNG